MTSVTIGSGVTSIGEYAFSSCYALTSVTIGSGVTSIGSNAFYRSFDITSVTIFDLSAWCKIDFKDKQSSPLYHGGKLYLNYQLLTELTIPEDITEIKNYAFYGCSYIEKVNISDNVTSIGEQAFYYCNNLSICYCYATNPPNLAGTPFYNIKSNATLYVPTRCGAAYNSSWWSSGFSKIIEMD